MNDTTTTPQTEQHTFQAEVQQLLHLMVHSLYSNREIFLRELISNAADACDKLRFQAISDDALLADDSELHIRVELDKDNNTITISDNGIGMSRDEVIENIGTIARSGTRQFLKNLEQKDVDQSQLIGQFGVGFYSSFIVAEQVTLETRRADQQADQATRWVSAGAGEYTLEAIEREQRGTSVVIKLKEDAEEFAQDYRTRSIIQRYSGHISFPVQMLHTPAKQEDSDTEPSPEWQAINDTTALWTKPKQELSNEDYQGFYQSLTNDHKPALSWTHNKVEGKQSYTSLLYVPEQAPFDMAYNRDERTGLKLYVQRVFIMDAAEQLLPRYLRFMRGVVDSSDLPLNVSREILQENELLNKIKSAVVKRSLDMLKKIGKDQEKYLKFWEQFGIVLKEGIVEDFGNRDAVADLLRFPSSKTENGELTSLHEYLERMPEEQEHIWYVTAENPKTAASSPHLEWFREQGIEVLLMGDRIDEWVMGHWHEYAGKSFKSIAKGELNKDEKPEISEDDQKLIDRLQELLKDKVQEVRATNRLTASAACLVVDEHAMAMHMQMMLQQAGQDIPASLPHLEVNLEHGLVKRIAETADEQFDDLGQLLFEQAVLSEGGQLENPAEFVQRINRLIA